MVEGSFLPRWESQVSDHPRLRRLRQPGIARSYPVFAYEQERLETRFFYHTAHQVGAHRIVIGPPEFCVALDPANGSVIATLAPEEFGIDPFENVIHEVPPERKESASANIRRLRALYDDVSALYPDRPAGATGFAFWEALRAVVPPPLLPAYEALSPEFADWLRG
jgi:hypothetical protein